MTRAEALAALKSGYQELIPGQKIVARLFEPGDALGVGRLFLQAYGTEYPVDDPYVPELLIEANRAGRIRTIVAQTEDGSIAGQGAFYQSSPPNKRVYEYGQMIVDKAYRGSFAAVRMHQFAVKNMFGKMEGVDAIYGEAVCHHLATQKMSRGVDVLECGLEPGLMPQEVYAGEGVQGRASCLYQQAVYQGGSGFLYLPEYWRSQIEAILPTWPLERDIRESGPNVEPSEDVLSQMDAQYFSFAGVMRLNVARPRADFSARLDQFFSEAITKGCVLFQVFLNLGEAWAGGAVEVLRRKGFFFGGFIPIWFGSLAPGPDALLVQRFVTPVTLEPIQTMSERGEKVVRMVFEDMARAGREFGSPQGTQLLPTTPGKDSGT